MHETTYGTILSRKRTSSVKDNEKEIGKLRGPNGHRLCRFCRTEVSPPRKTFCSDICVHNWRLRSDIKYLRKFIYQRDLGICDNCRIDTRYTKIELENAARESMMVSGKWSWEDNPIYINACRKYNITIKQSRGSLWDADHKIRVADGGGECDIDNIVTLCKSCHQKKSSAEIKMANKRKRNISP